MDFSKLNIIEKVVGGAGYVTGGVVGFGEYVYRRVMEDASHADANSKASKTAGQIADAMGEVGVQAAPEMFNALVGHWMGNALGEKPTSRNTDSCKCKT